MKSIKKQTIQLSLILSLGLAPLSLQSCSNAYYGAMEKVGIHKRDIMVDRVEAAKDAQQDAQQQFKSALEQFESVVHLQQTDLKQAYEKLNAEYEESLQAAEAVSKRIDKVKAVSAALFEEWKDELAEYQNASYRRSSEKQLNKTKIRYKKMIENMQQAEASMAPVLVIFKDNVLFLKHNLNAQAIGTLQGEFSVLQGEIDTLIKKMNVAIASSNSFIAEIRQ